MYVNNFVEDVINKLTVANFRSYDYFIAKVKVKLSLYQSVEAPTFYRQSDHRWR
jgi:hypothetical protein